LWGKASGDFLSEFKKIHLRPKKLKNLRCGDLGIFKIRCEYVEKKRKKKKEIIN